MGRRTGARRDERVGGRAAPGRPGTSSMGNPHAVAFVDDLADAGRLVRRAGLRRGGLPPGRQRRVRRAARGRGTSPCASTSAARARRAPAAPAPARRWSPRRWPTGSPRDDVPRRRPRGHARGDLDGRGHVSCSPARGRRRPGDDRPLSAAPPAPGRPSMIRPMDITGASALVTGGASGIGAAVARRLAAAGAHGRGRRPAGRARARRWPTRSAACSLSVDVTDTEPDPGSGRAGRRARARCGCWSTPPASAGRSAPSAATASYDSAHDLDRLQKVDRHQPDRHLRRDPASPPPR